MRRAVAFALAILAIATACVSAGPGEVRVLVAGDPEELAAYRRLVDAFHRANGDVRIRLEETPDRDVLLARLATATAGGAPPDVFLLNYRYVGSFVATGAVEPLDDLLGASDVLAADAFYPTARDAFRFDGQQMCLPQNAASLVVYWNADRFAEAGEAPPAADWTWDDMVAAASALTRDLDDDGRTDVYGLGVEPELLRLAPAIWSAGGELVDDPEAPSRLALRSGAALGAIRRFVELRAVHGVTPTEEETESQDLVSRFAAGGLAMLMESRKVVPSLRAAATFRWDVAPFPAIDEPSTVLHADGYCITAGSPRTDDAWRFVEFALGPEGQRITAAAGRTVPSLVEVAESPVFLEPSAPPASSRVYLDQLAVARPVPAIPAWPRIEDAANAVLEEAFYEPARRVETPEIALAMLRATAPAFGEAGRVTEASA